MSGATIDAGTPSLDDAYDAYIRAMVAGAGEADLRRLYDRWADLQRGAVQAGAITAEKIEAKAIDASAIAYDDASGLFYPDGRRDLLPYFAASRALMRAEHERVTNPWWLRRLRAIRWPWGSRKAAGEP